LVEWENVVANYAASYDVFLEDKGWRVGLLPPLANQNNGVILRMLANVIFTRRYVQTVCHQSHLEINGKLIAQY